MRDYEIARIDLRVAVHEKIEIDLARPPSFPGDASDVRFDPLQYAEEFFRGEAGIDLYYRIEEVGLFRTDGIRFIYTGRRNDFDVIVRVQRAHGLAKIAEPITDVRADTDVRTH